MWQFIHGSHHTELTVSQPTHSIVGMYPKTLAPASTAFLASSKVAFECPRASVWVHAYNGMRGLTHRELGMVGAMYELPHTYRRIDL